MERILFRVIKLFHGSYIAKLLVYVPCFIAVYHIRDPEIKCEYLANYDDDDRRRWRESTVRQSL